MYALVLLIGAGAAAVRWNLIGVDFRVIDSDLALGTLADN